ncbi:cysteine hydrolase [Henriciella sp. AS95]|uniref:cysteine hydrolase family protein n=1 Tax=Henriciella sp. AS95 TaxID=3135782 RepID=UPI0031718C1D
MNKHTPSAESLSDWVAPARTAVIVIDIQVDFASAEGVLGKAGVDMSITEPAVAAASQLVEDAREAGVPVIFVGLQTDAATDSPVWGEWRRRKNGVDEGGGICRSGTPGADFFGPKPEPGETVVPKLRYSGFFGTSLDAILRARQIDTLVVCGLTTECCVDCTVRDAFHLDYFVYVPTDACAAYDEQIHIGALNSLELNCATLVTTADLRSAWATQEESNQ